MTKSNNQATSSASYQLEESFSGLYLSGTIIDRTRRLVPFDNPSTEIITYTVQASGNRKYYLEAYAPESYYNVGEDVQVPVYIKPYRRKNGDLSYTLMIQQKTISRGERF